jgi:phage shock protein A
VDEDEAEREVQKASDDTGSVDAKYDDKLKGQRAKAEERWKKACEKEQAAENKLSEAEKQLGELQQQEEMIKTYTSERGQDANRGRQEEALEELEHVRRRIAELEAQKGCSKCCTVQ